jgi:hypothetical protein
MPWVSSNEKQGSGSRRIRLKPPSSRRYHRLGRIRHDASPRSLCGWWGGSDINRHAWLDYRQTPARGVTGRCDVHLSPASVSVEMQKCGNRGLSGLPAFPPHRLEIISSSLVEIRETAISHVHHFHPLRGTCPPWTWSAGPGRRGIGRARRCHPCAAIQSKIAACRIQIGRDPPLLEWPTSRPEHLSGCFRVTRSSDCWRSINFTWRRNITRATARISHRPT